MLIRLLATVGLFYSSAAFAQSDVMDVCEAFIAQEIEEIQGYLAGDHPHMPARQRAKLASLQLASAALSVGDYESALSSLMAADAVFFPEGLNVDLYAVIAAVAQLDGQIETAGVYGEAAELSALIKTGLVRCPADTTSEMFLAGRALTDFHPATIEHVLDDMCRDDSPTFTSAAARSWPQETLGSALRSISSRSADGLVSPRD